MERLKQQLEETNVELQVKERELKKLKIQSLLETTDGDQQQHAYKSNGYLSVQKTKMMDRSSRLSEGGNNLQKLLTQGQFGNTQYQNDKRSSRIGRNSMDQNSLQQIRSGSMIEGENAGEDENVFERAETLMTKRHLSDKHGVRDTSSAHNYMLVGGAGYQQTLEDEQIQEEVRDYSSSSKSGGNKKDLNEMDQKHIDEAGNKSETKEEECKVEAADIDDQIKSDNIVQEDRVSERVANLEVPFKPNIESDLAHL